MMLSILLVTVYLNFFSSPAVACTGPSHQELVTNSMARQRKILNIVEYIIKRQDKLVRDVAELQESVEQIERGTGF